MSEGRAHPGCPGGQLGRGREAVVEDRPGRAERLQAPGRDRIGAQEVAEAAIQVLDEQGALEIRKPVDQQVMRDRGIFLDVVVNEVAVAVAEQGARFRQLPDMINENFQLQGEVQQVVRQAVGAEERRRSPGPGRRASPGIPARPRRPSSVPRTPREGSPPARPC